MDPSSLTFWNVAVLESADPDFRPIAREANMRDIAAVAAAAVRSHGCDDVHPARLMMFIVKDAAGVPAQSAPSGAECMAAVASGDAVALAAELRDSVLPNKCWVVLKIDDADVGKSYQSPPLLP